MTKILKKIVFSFVSFVLVLTFVWQTPLTILAESMPKYLKEIRLATASTKAEAVAALESEGYQVMDRNLREGVSGSVCYLGYKTTTDEKEAITDIRLMNANGGLNEKKYRDMVSEWKKGIETSAESLKDACLATAANYAKGSPLAQAAVEILDLFEVDGVKLSTYLFDSNRTDLDYQDILLICADNVVTTIYGALHLGTADYGTDTFASRLAKVNFNHFDYSNISSSIDSQEFAEYWELTARVIGQLQNFGMAYDEALDFFSVYEESEEEGTTPVTPTEEETQEYWKKFVDEKYKNSEIDEEQELYKHANVIGLYEKMAQYPLANSSYENLADYIYTCGDPFDEDGEETDKIVWRIYPLVSCLTKGQIFTLQYGGVSALVSALDANTEANKNNAVAAVGELKTKVRENGLERISVFYNVNRNLYNETVAFTTEAERIATASSSYDKLVQPKEDDQVIRNITNVILIGGIIAGSLLAASVLILGITAAVAGTTMAVLVDVGITAILAGSIGIASGGMTIASAAIIAGVVGTVIIVAVLVILAILVICVIIAFFYRLFHDDDEEEEAKAELPDIPNRIFDVVGSDFTEYEAVMDKNGNPIDLTCGEGREWDVMYVSYSEKAGTPIKIDKDGFVFKTDSNVAPSGYTPVSRFGYIDTANLHSFTSSTKTPLYMFYQGQSRDGDKGQKYLADIMLSAENSAEAARLGIIKKGFTPIEQNLTPNTGKVSYIGYVTTNNPDDAITDIRIAYYYSGKSYLYGNKSDGSAVEYTCVGEMASKASLYYTKQKSNGSAILADIRFSSSRLSADSGYEPVILFSGGEGYNFYIGCNEWNGIRVMEEGQWGNTLYMYFKPSVSFNSSNTEYISGFAFCSGNKNAQSFAEQNGFQLTPIGQHNLANGTSEGATYILYSTTHNPYRAITEIGTFNASQSADGLYDNISVGGVGYAVCETFACVCDEGFFVDDYYRMLRPSNGYITRLDYEGSCVFELDSTYQAENNFGKYENIPMKGLYVAGPNSQKKSLTLDDVNFCTEKDTAGRTAFVNSKGETVFCKPANDLTDCYSRVADNLTFEWDYRVRSYRGDFDIYYSTNIVFENYLRIFYRGSVETRGKYVSNIIVSTVEPESDNDKKYSYDQAVVKLLSKGEGEILKVNFACSSSAQPITQMTVSIDGENYTINVCKNYTGVSSYIMVQYTDYLMSSLRAATTKWYTDSSEKPASKLSYQGVNFNLSGDKVKGISGSYAIYTSRNGQLGSAVTDVLLDSDYLKNGWTTVSDSDGYHRTGEDYILKIKQVNDGTSQSYITNLTVSSQGSRQSCIADLYKQGCTNFIDQDKNQGLGGNFVYIGYATTINEDDRSIVRGIKVMCYSSSSHPASFTDDDGLVYGCISNDLNKGVGGDYTYLYISGSQESAPIIRLSTTTIMADNLTNYTEYRTHTWVTTNNASSGTSGTYKLCYKQKDNSWHLTSDGALVLDFKGDMKDYQKDFYIFYTKPGAMGAMRKLVSYLPEWCDYGEAITSVFIMNEVTSVDDCAFVNCNNIGNIWFFNDQITIKEGAIPTNSVIVANPGSTAFAYAESHNIEHDVFPRVMFGATVIGNRNVIVIISIISVFVLGGIVALIIKRKKHKKEANSHER